MKQSYELEPLKKTLTLITKQYLEILQKLAQRFSPGRDFLNLFSISGEEVNIQSLEKNNLEKISNNLKEYALGFISKIQSPYHIFFVYKEIVIILAIGEALDKIIEKLDASKNIQCASAFRSGLLLDRKDINDSQPSCEQKSLYTISAGSL